MKGADLARAAERLRSIGDDMMAAPSHEAFLQALCRLRVLEREMRLAADVAVPDHAARWCWIEHPPAVTVPPAILRQRLVVHQGGRRA